MVKVFHWALAIPKSGWQNRADRSGLAQAPEKVVRTVELFAEAPFLNVRKLRAEVKMSFLEFDGPRYKAKMNWMTFQLSGRTESEGVDYGLCQSE